MTPVQTAPAAPLLLPAPRLIDNVFVSDALAFLRCLPSDSVDCCVSSPPYFGLRSYLPDGHPSKPDEIGLQDTPAAFVARLVEVYREVRRVLKPTGTCWVNMGDSFASAKSRYSSVAQTLSGHERGEPTTNNKPDLYLHGYKDKDLLMIPARLAIALQDDGWWIRSEIVWAKPNPMPESVTDRPTKAHEMVYMLTRAPRYWYDADAIREGALSSDPSHEHYRANGKSDSRVKHIGATGVKPAFGNEGLKIFASRNRRSVWTVATEPFSGVSTDGTYRIASRDCPVHDYRADEARVLRYDAQQDASQFARNPDSGIHPSQVQEGAVVSIPLDQSASLWDASFAIPHSKRSYRTADELARDVIFFGIPTSRTEYTALIRRSVAKFDHIHANKTSVDASLDVPLIDPSVQTVYRTFGIVALGSPLENCTCYYTGKVEKRQDHFACFPQKLIEPMILAGCPATVCARCGKPYVRVTESHIEFSQRVHNHQKYPTGQLGHQAANRHQDGHIPGTKHVTTLGFAPSCDCRAGTVPGVVLDPFMGSGTVALVARRLGRSYIGCDLNPEYVALANERLSVPYTPPMALDAPAPQPAAVQEVLL